MTPHIRPTSRVTASLTTAGELARYYHAHPEERPASAPDPDRQPAEFAEWVRRNTPPIVKLKKVTK